jgi:hypothetical protein
MELDDLKNSWKQTELKTNKNTDIMELVQHRSYGPVAALKRAFRKQALMMGMMPFILISVNINKSGNIFTSVLFWSYVLLCIGMIIFGYINYRLAGKMELVDDNMKASLTRQIDTIEKRLGWKLIALRAALIFFAVLIEVLPYFQHYRMLDKWHSLPVAARYGTYLGFFILQFFLSKSIHKRNYGTHLAYLKKLADELE